VEEGEFHVRELSTVIPGHAEGVSPESITTELDVMHRMSVIEVFVVMDSGPRCARPE
jgi:hypothetical protein